MTEKQTEAHDNIGRYWGAYKRAMPEIAEAYDALPMEAYKDGAVSGKHKRLMALVGSLIGGCQGCILYQTENALVLGATVEEILETCAVAVSLGGTMASSQTARVVEYLTEKGLMR